jgi:hypothetical protein
MIIVLLRYMIYYDGEIGKRAKQLHYAFVGIGTHFVPTVLPNRTLSYLLLWMLHGNING